MAVSAYIAELKGVASPYVGQLQEIASPYLSMACGRYEDIRELVTPHFVHLQPLLAFAQRMEDSLPAFPYPIAYVAAAAIVLHVANYNLTARLEHSTRIFTKIFRSSAIYLYAVYLIVSALVRDHYVMQAVESSTNSYILFTKHDATLIGNGLITFGILLNIWVVKSLGIKGTYNGDSFGYLMDAPVTGGPFRFFNDPQYVGTTAALLGYAVKHQSIVGYALTAVLWVVFSLSVKLFEGPHMNRIYAKKKTPISKKKL
ncbi:phospholipid methyltransferase-domain-containing protein [Gaertneriomyces semiglobifer]|nr:phospholipid methyltransferase-domain-containing protein [Gaertneriomyces semiglobifer]